VEGYTPKMPHGSQLPFCKNFPISSLEDKFFQRGGHVRDITPHVVRITYFHVIKVNINKA
jgi:hypothetical protein